MQATTVDAGRDLKANKGPQRAFLSTRADIAIYGGAAGAGKSFALTLDMLRHVHRKGFGAVVFRRTSDRLTGSGSMWEEMSGIYPSLSDPPTPRQNPLEWRFPSGALIELKHLQYAHDVHAHQSKQYAGIYFDELTEFEESQFWYLLSRLRTTCGIKPYVRATCNPDPDSFVRKLIAWWIGDDGLPVQDRSGALRWLVRDGDEIVWFDSEGEALEAYPDRNPLSLTFIAAKLEDNPKGDPLYRDKLMALPLVERSRLLGGNWNIRPAPGNYFKRGWFRVMPPGTIPPSEIVTTLRCWDKAATEVSAAAPNPDWTRGAKVSWTKDKRLIIHDIQGCRRSPGGVDAFMRGTAEADGIRVAIKAWEDPGQAGKVDTTHIGNVLTGYAVGFVRAREDKETYAGPWSSMAEQGRVIVEEGPWNDAFFAEAEAFAGSKGKGKKDQIDAVSLAAHCLISGVVEYGYSPAKPNPDRQSASGRPARGGRGAMNF